MPKSLILFLLVSIGLAACSGQGQHPSSQESLVLDSSRNDRNDVSSADLWSRIGALPAQRVPPGSCGLFLWANMPDRALVFYSDNATSTGAIQLDGQQIILPRSEAMGETRLGQFLRQTFENDQLLVAVSFHAEVREGLSKGAIVREGTLRIEEKSGWEIVAPVAGLIGCN